MCLDRQPLGHRAGQETRFGDELIVSRTKPQQALNLVELSEAWPARRDVRNGARLGTARSGDEHDDQDDHRG